MKHFTLWKSFLLLCALVVGSNVWATVPTNPKWVATALADISDNATVIIISNSTQATNIALPSTTTTSNPAKKACTVSTTDGVSTITPPTGTSIQDLAWTLSKVTSGKNTSYKFFQEGSTTIRLYLTGLSSNTALRVGDATSSNDEFVLGDLGKLLKVTTGTRFVGSYDNNGSDWRTYNTENATNYKGSTLTFYVLQASSDPTSAASFDDKTPSINFPAYTTYSQVPGTAAGYGGTITYEITANTAGASINESSGLVTVTQEGSVTVKATAAAVPGSFAASSDSYTLTVTDTRTDNGLEYAETDQEVTVGEVLAPPALTNPNGLSVTYSSEDEDIATVDASGNVTGVAVGSTTITASFAGNETYKAGSASYTITVKKAAGVAVDGVFDFSYEDEIDYGTGLQPSTTDIKEAKTFTAGNITLTPEPTANNKYWRWWTDGTLRLYTDTKMTIAAPDGYVMTNIGFVGTQNLDAVSISEGNYSAATDNKSATWTGSAQSIVFTRNGSNPFFTTITVTYAKQLTVSYADGWMSYVTPSAITFPENVEAYVVTALSPSLTREKITSAPAGTPVVLHATEGAKTYALPVAASADDPASNELKVSDGTIVGNGKIYVLTVKGGQAGFAPLKDTSTLSAGKVYIEFPTAPAKDFIGFDDGETTNISNLNANGNLNTTGQMYNLAGQKVSESYKGIVIVNGKKMIRK